MTAGGTAPDGPGLRVDPVVPDRGALDVLVEELVRDGVAGRTARQDPTLWGPDAEEEAARRLGWVEAPARSRPLVAPVSALHEELTAAGVTRVVLCGMGGSSLAPEVLCASAGLALEVLDSSSPDEVRSMVTDLARTVVVVSSKSGGTLETDNARRAFEQGFTDAGIDPAERIVVVTDPGSPLAEDAAERGYRVFEADPDVGGRYSALTAYGLVPSGLAGLDLAGLLDEAEQARTVLESDDPGNPALRLGAVLGQAARAGVDKVALADAGAPFTGLGDWAEQLLAESTGKQGSGVLPLVVESPASPGFSPATADTLPVALGAAPAAAGPSGYAVGVAGSLAGQLLLWEYATAVAGRLLRINPFDQPDVESAKAAAREMLDGTEGPAEPSFTDAGVTVYAHGDWLPAGVTTVADAVAALLDRVDDAQGYLAVQAFLDRRRDAGVAETRPALAQRTGRPVTFGWGPRFLHSTGQYHKGGPPTGVFLQLTTEPEEDLTVPGRPYTFQQFLTAQATGDARVLAGHGRPVLRLHAARPSLLPTLASLLDGSRP